MPVPRRGVLLDSAVRVFDEPTPDLTSQNCCAVSVARGKGLRMRSVVAGLYETAHGV